MLDFTPVDTLADDLIPAVAYYRMSSDDQTTSIAQQMKEVREYARLRGYKIIREYVDEGKSASKDQEKRVEFQRLLLDSNKGDFQVVLCWSSSRFTRQDGYESAFAKQVLRLNNIFLDTVKEGKRDFNTFEGRLADFISTEQDHKYSRDLAAASVRGRQDAFDRGKCPFGRIPFGYARRYFYGDKVHIVKRKESFRKPRGWDSEVIIDEDEAATVRFIFKTFAERDLSYGQMLRILTEQGIPAPDGSPWHLSGLRYLLGNKAYIGICVVAAHRFASAKKRGKFAPFKPGERTGIIPAIVDQDTFDAVQAKLARRSKGDSTPRGDTYSPLCGIVYCGKCGCRMTRETIKKRAGTYKASNGKTYKRTEDKTYLRYKCCSYCRIPGKGCHGWGVSDSELMPRILAWLVEEVDTELLLRLRAIPEHQAISDIDVREKQAEQLRKQIEQAEERYLTAPSHMMPGLERRIAEWRTQLDQLETEVRVLQAARNQEGLGSLLEWWKEKKIMLLDLSDPARGKEVDPGIVDEGMGIAVEPDKLREFLHRIGVKVTLFFKPREGTSACARHRRRQWEKEGRKPHHTYYAVDWDRSLFSVAFKWDGSPLNNAIPLSGKTCDDSRVCPISRLTSTSAIRRRTARRRRSGRW